MGKSNKCIFIFVFQLFFSVSVSAISVEQVKQIYPAAMSKAGADLGNKPSYTIDEIEAFNKEFLKLTKLDQLPSGANLIYPGTHPKFIPAMIASWEKEDDSAESVSVEPLVEPIIDSPIVLRDPAISLTDDCTGDCSQVVVTQSQPLDLSEITKTYSAPLVEDAQEDTTYFRVGEVSNDPYEAVLKIINDFKKGLPIDLASLNEQQLNTLFALLQNASPSVQNNELYRLVGAQMNARGLITGTIEGIPVMDKPTRAIASAQIVSGGQREANPELLELVEVANEFKTSGHADLSKLTDAQLSTLRLYINNMGGLVPDNFSEFVKQEEAKRGLITAPVKGAAIQQELILKQSSSPSVIGTPFQQGAYDSAASVGGDFHEFHWRDTPSRGGLKMEHKFPHLLGENFVAGDEYSVYSMSLFGEFHDQEHTVKVRNLDEMGKFQGPISEVKRRSAANGNVEIAFLQIKTNTGAVFEEYSVGAEGHVEGPSIVELAKKNGVALTDITEVVTMHNHPGDEHRKVVGFHSSPDLENADGLRAFLMRERKSAGLPEAGFKILDVVIPTDGTNNNIAFVHELNEQGSWN